MKLFTVQKDVMSGQCKGALLRLQVRYTAYFLFPGLIPGWVGSQIGLFTPVKKGDEYTCRGFYFHPWLAKDVAISQLPKWYRWFTGILSFGKR